MNLDPRLPYLPADIDDDQPLTVGWMRQYLERYYELHRENRTEIRPVQQTYLSATDKVLGRQSAGGGAGEEITCTSFGRTLMALLSTDLATFGSVRAGMAGSINTGTGSLANAAFSTWTGSDDAAAGLLIARDGTSGGVFLAIVDTGISGASIISDPSALTGVGKWSITFPGGNAFRLLNSWGGIRLHKSTFISAAGFTNFT